MLIGNGVRLGMNPGRLLGGAHIISLARASWGDGGAQRCWFAGQGTIADGGASVADRNGSPSGYLHPAAWMLPQKPGGMASRGRIVGTGGITDANLAGGLNAEAALTGSGDIVNAALGLIVSMVANLTGTATLSADITGKLEATADLAGSGDLVGALGAIADLGASLSGTSAVAGELTGKGALAASIVVTGDLLNTANVGPAILAQLLEGNIDVGEALRLILANAAGEIEDLGGASRAVKAAGAPGTTRIEADVTAKERSNITLTP